MKDCIFCKIVAGEIPCDKVYEDDEHMAFQTYDQQQRTYADYPKEHEEDLLETKPETIGKCS